MDRAATKMRDFLISLFGLGCWFCSRRGCLYKKPYADCDRWKGTMT